MKDHMKHRNTLLTLTTLLLAPLAALHGADVELTETLQLPECHSIGWVNSWVKADPEVRGKGWNGVLDEAKWGTPSLEPSVPGKEMNRCGTRIWK